MAGKEEPGGKEEQRTSGDGKRGVGKRQALRRSPLLKTRGVAGIVCFVRK